MKRRAFLTSGGAVLIGTAIYAFTMLAADSTHIVLRDADSPTVTRGAAVYQAHCASCHGADLQGQDNWRSRDKDGRLPAPPHDATGHTWHHDAGTLFGLTKYGIAAMIDDPDYVSDMPIYQDVLTDDEIIAVLSYIKLTWPEEIRARHNEMENR